MHRCVLYENVNVVKIAREPLSQVQLTAICREIREMAGRLGTHVARLGSDCFQHVHPAADKVEAGSSPGEGKGHGCSQPSSSSRDDGRPALECARLQAHPIKPLRRTGTTWEAQLSFRSGNSYHIQV